jgi:hypothetical protein
MIHEYGVMLPNNKAFVARYELDFGDKRLSRMPLQNTFCAYHGDIADCD